MTLRRAACHHPFVVLNPGCPHATVEGKLVPRTTCLNTNKKKKIRVHTGFHFLYSITAVGPV